MEKEIIVKFDDWESSVYRTKEWEDSVEIKRWEKNYEFQFYKITYIEQSNLSQ